MRRENSRSKKVVMKKGRIFFEKLRFLKLNLKNKILFTGIVFFVIVMFVPAAEIKVDPSKCVIVLPEKADDTKKSAAEELRKHLELVTGADIPLLSGTAPVDGKYSFCIGIMEQGNSKELEAEEARWVVTSTAVYLYGDDSRSRKGNSFAVYGFLEDELGVHWIEPGDDGTVYKIQSPLVLKEGNFGWVPKLGMRIIRGGSRLDSPVKAKNLELKVLEKSMKEHNKDVYDTREWLNRMRMGNNMNIAYGHAFTDWWKKYGKSHPEYFALNKYGKREPEIESSKESSPENPLWKNLKGFTIIKLCPSNPSVKDQIIQNWLELKKHSHYINVCENDKKGYCRCTECRKLDGHNDNLDIYQVHLSDRYIYLANGVAREAKKHDPEAYVTTYAYNETEYPPRREHLEPNVIIGIVPTTIDLEKLEELYGGWEKMGAKKIFLRPNTLHYVCNIGVPLGIEKRMFDAFQLAVKHGCVGVDYDSLKHSWTLSGISDYILAKAISDPSKPFEKWEDEYYSAFGASSSDVKKYYQYWRNEVWENRLAPDVNDIDEKGKFHNFVRGLMWNLSKYYKETDFDKTDAILKKAAENKLTEIEKKRLDRLILSNEHSRLVFKAITTQGTERFKYSKELFSFRLKHQDNLKLSWLSLIENEEQAGDITGIYMVAQLGKFSQPWIQTPLFWYFKMDQQNVGLNEEWQKECRDKIQKEWELLPTNSSWSSSPSYYKYPSVVLREKLKKYKGIGWYSQQLEIPVNWKDKYVYLCFGAVDKSCWVYVNGKEVGKHIFTHPDDWRSSFTIRIDENFSKDKKQMIMIRVESGGVGGIWKRVWLVSAEKENL
ncbi:MAG: hypothetical protein UT30_C0023G0002 [Candidatus Uhrbacteria bacterium GW2011_GWF2_39_13]|uniref:Glycosyl hydrolases family 2 sugar binding domain-containing protein n=1 Tax=Candidatus Uhrbacteria bacterium GW2011_GWF2_39_13 TaxID=1618995 RepID=A0A0G0MHZ8_9BACT|nr:MAG: hypothetical protein UT30_C0023G0002 [Candidatus Uhrbacteria bacterium GW2011_GWF2_39_13]